MANTPRILNMRPDPPDLRDRLYNPSLRSLDPEFNARAFDHPAWRARVKDQGLTSARTGFALAAMVETLALTRRMRFHLIGHSAGAFFHAHLLPELLRARLTVQGIYLMAPACRIDLFIQKVAPAYESGKIPAYTQFHMSDKVEQDDNCVSIYNRSLLYLVSNACERKPRTPILGMEKFAHLVNPAKPPSSKVKVWGFISAPTASDATLTARCHATSHGAFDNDPDAIRAILERIKRSAR